LPENEFITQCLVFFKRFVKGLIERLETAILSWNCVTSVVWKTCGNDCSVVWNGICCELLLVLRLAPLIVCHDKAIVTLPIKHS